MSEAETQIVEAPEEGQRLPSLTFTTEQIELIKRTVAVGATDDELALFLHTAKRCGLDPLVRQIHFVKRKSNRGADRAAFQVGIDGYRLAAQRTNECGGNDDPVYDDEEKPRKATVTVYRIVKGVRCPYTATARWDQYCPGDGPEGFMWRKMPHLMLGKCAEALALRKAFPAELSGVYTHEEMQQAGPAINAPTAASTAATSKPAAKARPAPASTSGKKITAGQCKLLYARRMSQNIGNERFDQYIHDVIGVNVDSEIPFHHINAVLAWIGAGGPDWQKPEVPAAAPEQGDAYEPEDPQASGAE